VAVTRETLRLLDGMRVSVGAHVDDVTRTLVSAWARSWDVLAAAWQQAIEDVIAEVEDGRWPSQTQIDRLDRAQRALGVTRTQVLQLGDLAGVTVIQLLPTITSQALVWQRALVESQLPTPAQLQGITSTVSVEFNRVDPHAIDAIVRRTTQDITSELATLSPDAEEAMRRRLIEGIALGDNPRAAAARMLRDVEGQFNGGLARALNVARTEMLDAHRNAGRAADLANPKLVTGWTWGAVLDTRTCPSCWSKHGEHHPADEPGPYDHQSGRCARIPDTESWSSLGFDIPEPASLLPDAESTFYALPESKQLQIMGPARLEALTSGKAQWGELSVRRTSAGWRDSHAVRPVRDLLRVSS
jgi:hypothetical protein